MSITKTGAWFAAYKAPCHGTKDVDLTSDSDNFGNACIGWKKALIFSGFKENLNLSYPGLGDEADKQIRLFQMTHSLSVDGDIGPHTGERLLRQVFRAMEVLYQLSLGCLWQVGAQESWFDTGAIGFVDPLDRGAVQVHVYNNTTVTLSQVTDPVYAIKMLAQHVSRVKGEADLETGIASWNVGEGSSLWWYNKGKPQTGSPVWWPAGSGDLSTRCWRYLAAVHSHTLPATY